MKYYTYKVLKSDEDWSSFVIFLCKENFDNGENMYEMYPLLQSDMFSKKNVPCIGLFGINERDMLQRNFPGYRIIKIGENSKRNLVKERLKYILSKEIERKYALSYWGMTEEYLNEIIKISPDICVNDELCNRWAFETFLYKKDMITKRQLSVNLGLKENSFEQLIEIIRERFAYNLYFRESLGLYPQNFIRQLMIALFPNEFFSSKIEFLRKLYLYLQREGVLLEKETCFISRALKERKKKMPAYIDIMLNLPVSAEYSVSIRNGKPGFLPPDRISFYTYLLNDDEFYDRRIMVSQREFDQCLENIERKL